MLDTKSPLIAEFLKDHQQLSRLLVEISNLLEKNELEKARERAIELNSVAGPHIAYEEAELYSRLKDMGEKSVTEEELVHQHRDIVDALKLLLETQNPDDQTLQSIRSGFQSAIAHAEHCGTLITFLSRMDEKQKAASLDRLLQFRKDGKVWTELD